MMNAVPAHDWRFAERAGAACEPGLPVAAGDDAVAALIVVRRSTSSLTRLNRQLSGKSSFSLEDLAEQALYIDETAGLHLDLLWRLCLATGDDALADQYSTNAKRFGAELSGLYLSCIRQLAHGMPAPGVRRTLLFVRAMHAIRVLFQWHWLRYETPDARYWKAASDIEEFAARESRHHMAQRLYRYAGVDACVSSEYYAMRFMEWLGPSSLTPVGLDALARAASGTLQTLPQDTQCGDLSGWLVQLQKRMRDWSRLPPGQAGFDLPQGRRARFEGAGRGAVEMQRTAFFQCGFSAIAAQASRLMSQDKPDWHGSAVGEQFPCMIRSMSNEGWRMHARAGCRGGLQVGALVAMPDGAASLSLGIVRWLARGADGSWEAGVTALAACFSGFVALDTGGTGVPVLIADSRRLAEGRVVIAILPGGWPEKNRTLRLHTPSVALEMSGLVEAGQDFDIVAMLPRGEAGAA